jgi:hypothetical protein
MFIPRSRDRFLSRDISRDKNLSRDLYRNKILSRDESFFRRKSAHDQKSGTLISSKVFLSSEAVKKK